MMSIDHRLRKLEAIAPADEPLVVHVTRTIVAPGPDGVPVPTGSIRITTHQDGILTKLENIRENLELSPDWVAPTEPELDAYRATINRHLDANDGENGP